MGAIPRKIADFFNSQILLNIRSILFEEISKTVLSEKGIGLVELKQHGRWKRASVCEHYVNNTIGKNMKTCGMI